MTPEVICDYVTVTTPAVYGDDLRGALSDVCLALPDAATDPLGVRLGKFGLLRFSQRPGIAIASASGVVLAALREAGALLDYCTAVASVVSFNVTHVDVASDELCDVPGVLEAEYLRLASTGVNLTRKRIGPGHVRKLFSRGVDGRDTGSVMIGNRGTSRVSAILYDRQHDAISKGKPDPGLLLRREIRVGLPGLSLHDVIDPAPLFYHLASPGLVPWPTGMRDWLPRGEGFTVDRPRRDAMEKIQRLVERSTDLQRLFDLADQLPGEGIDVLVHVIRAQARRRHKGREMGRPPKAPGGSEAVRPSDLANPDA